MIPQIQIPDFTGTIQRQQALQQQGEMSRLQALALQRAADSDTRLNKAYAAAAPGLMAGSGPAFQSALLTLMRGGREGLAVALPLMQQQRERDEAASFWGDGGGAPQMPQASVPAPNGPISPSSDPVMLARAAAEERARIPRDAPDYEARIQAINDRLIAQAGPRGGSTSRTTSTTVPAMPGWDDGIPAPGAAPRVTPASAPAGGAGGGRSGVSDGELRRIEMGLGSPNRIIQQQAQARLQMLQFRLRDSGQEPLVEIADPSSPTGRRLVQRSQAAGQPAPGPQDREGPRPTWAQNTILEVGPVVEAGRATPAQIEQFRMAVDYYTRDQLNPATGQITPGLPATPQMQRAMNAIARAEGRPLPFQAGAIAPGNDAAPAPTAPAAPAPSGNALARPSVTEESPSGSSRTIRPPQTTPQALEAYRKAEVETGKVNDAIRGFREALQAAGGTGINAYLNNPRDPAAVRLNTAFNNLVIALRAEPFLNTGVLQPGEIALIDRNLLNPQSLRGLLATNGGYEAMLGQVEEFIASGLARQRESAGLGAQIGRSGMTAEPPARSNVPAPPPGFQVIQR